jgi:hypothetical protein
VAAALVDRIEEWGAAETRDRPGVTADVDGGAARRFGEERVEVTVRGDRSRVE